MATQALALVQRLEQLEDPRSDHAVQHALSDIIALAVFAVIAGAEGWEDVEEFGLQKESWLRQYLPLANGIPSHDTISRVICAIRPSALQGVLLDWQTALNEQLGLKCVAIDGKTLRRSHHRRTLKSSLHLVCAWSVENHVVLGQQATHAKSNEITAIPELLKKLAISGAIVTIDAMGCQKEIAAEIVKQGADYLLQVKDNQPTLHAAIAEHFLQLHEADFVGSTAKIYTTKNGGHDRQEHRTYYMDALPDSLRYLTKDWKQLTSIGQVISLVRHADGRETSSVRYHISSRPPRVKEYATAARGHWRIENTLHWTLDITFREDESRIRKDHGPENFATLRRFALGLLKRDKSKGSVRKKRKRAAWNTSLLLSYIRQAS